MVSIKDVRARYIINHGVMLAKVQGKISYHSILNSSDFGVRSENMNAVWLFYALLLQQHIILLSPSGQQRL